jgi:L-amino acid N-acyltransferase YncA
VTRIRPITEIDYPAVAEIYQQGIDTENATFELSPPTWETFSNKFIDFSKVVAVTDNRISGWAGLSRVSTREVYSGVCEVSVYVHKDFRGLGIGKTLLTFLIQQSEAFGIWTIQAGIFPENISSISLHTNLGFRTVGYREKIGKMNGQWRDTVLLERRSKKETFE